MSRPLRVFLLTCLVAAGAALLAAAPAGARPVPGSPPFRILIMDHVSTSQFAQLAKRGAVGLLVPGVGPSTNRRQALAELERGTEVNARMGGVPAGRRLVGANQVTGTPTGRDVIVLALPPRGAP